VTCSILQHDSEKCQEDLWKLFKEKAVTSRNQIQNAADNNNNNKRDEVEISTSNVKGRKISGKIEIYLLQQTKKKEKLRQLNIKKTFDKFVHQYIACFWYKVHLSFISVKC